MNKMGYLWRNHAIVIVLISVLSRNSNGLKIDGNEEGQCSLPEPQKYIDPQMLENIPVWYLTGGSRYQLYRFAAGSAFFTYAREFEFFYGYCGSSTLNMNTSVFATRGFDGPTGNYKFTVLENGVLDFRPQSPVPGAGQQLLSVFTLTDNSTFIFTYQCWTQTNQRGWILYTTEGEITPEFQKRIEEHAISLGFDREQFQFLRRDFCYDDRYQPKCYNEFPGSYYPNDGSYYPGLYSEYRSAK